MGLGASVDGVAAAVAASTADDLQTCMGGLDEATRKKIRTALMATAAASETEQASDICAPSRFLPDQPVAPADVGSNDAENKGEQQVVYLTGYNATGKTTMGQYIADTHNEWHCVDGDEFVDNDPQLKELMIGASKAVVHLMRGTFGDYLIGTPIEEVKKHDAEVRTAMEPLFRAIFEKLKQIKESKIVFVYHVWRQWAVDVFREYFPTSTFVEVQVTRSLLLDRYVSRMVKKGTNLETVWKDQGEQITMLREKYGPEYKGNEEHFKKYVEWRYFFYREPVWEEAQNHFYVINNDNFDGAQHLEKILNLSA